jgi:hypothetical protein
MRDSTARRYGNDQIREDDGISDDRSSSGPQDAGLTEHGRLDTPLRPDEDHGHLPVSEVVQGSRQCPRCGFPQPTEVGECLRCGVVVSKFTERTASMTDRDPARMDGADDSTATRRKTRGTVALCVVTCVVLGWVVLEWSSAGHKAQYARGGPESVQSTGGVKRFTVSNFSQEVLNVSQKQPVLIEFYAHT